MSLKLDGKPLNLNRDTPGIVALRKFLDAAPKDEVFTSATIMDKLRIGQTLLFARANRELDTYTMVHGRNRYWGNPKAIEALATAVGR